VIAAVVVVPISVAQNRGILWPPGHTASRPSSLVSARAFGTRWISDDPGWCGAPAVTSGALAGVVQRIGAGDITASLKTSHRD
jgi:hypothetical protein